MTMWIAQNRGHRNRHQAFTLVELLVVITIISLIAVMTLMTLNGVREDARERRARSQVAKIHESIMQQWEGYRTRAVPVSTLTSGMDSRNASGVRLNALRELMRMELPDRKTDLLSPDSDDPSIPLGQTRFLRSSPTLWRAYVRRARQQILGKIEENNRLTGSTDPDTGNPEAWKTRWSPEHQSAECLYLILATMRDGDTTGLDFFTEAEIGDTDNDGMPEILDAWGRPIYFLRWAPGFRSDIQPGDFERDATTGLNNAGTGNGDPFDPLKMDPRWRDGNPENDPFVLYPLVISAGRDGRLDTLVDFPMTPPFTYNSPSPVVGLYNDPYVIFDHPQFGVVQLGYENDIDGDGQNGYSDNITSHFVEVR